MTRFGVCIADVHIGSKFSAWPENFVPKYGGEVKPSRKMLWCNDRLKDIEETLRRISERGSLEWVVFNGDIVDGVQKGWKAFEAVSTFPVDQVRAAEILLKPIASLFKKTYYVIGTEFHDGEGGSIVEGFADKIGAVPNENGQHGRWQLFLDDDKLGTFHFSHYMGTSQIPFYRGTQLAREGMLGTLAKSKGVPKLTDIVRSHNHYFNVVIHSSQRVISTPALQLQTPYMMRKGPFAFIPEIGFLVFEEVDDKLWNEWSYLHKFFYKLQPPGVERV